MSYYLVLDVGTTNVKAFAYSDDAVIGTAEERINPLFPEPGWVEEDPAEALEKTLRVSERIIGRLGRPLGVSVTNQRSTTILWDRETGEPLYNMITWQDTRTARIAEYFSAKFIMKLGRALGRMARMLIGIAPNLRRRPKISYMATLAAVRFGTNHSSMHIRWLMDNVEGIKAKIESGRAMFGTIDSWTAWNLTGKHVTDYTNASATGLYDPFSLRWSDTVLKVVEIPGRILPTPIANSQPPGTIVRGGVLEGLPLLAIIADQQASLYSAGVLEGTAKITNGTGAFIDINVGHTPMPGGLGVFPMITLKTVEKTLYLLEGIVQTVGSAFDWLVKIGLVDDVSELSKTCLKYRDTGGVSCLPALAGLGTPYWNPEAKARFEGITLSTERGHMVAALVKGIALRCAEAIAALEEASGIHVDKITADGMASNCDALLQFIADATGKMVEKAENLNGSSRGAYLIAKANHEGEDPVNAWAPPSIQRRFTPSQQKI